MAIIFTCRRFLSAAVRFLCRWRRREPPRQLYPTERAPDSAVSVTRHTVHVAHAARHKTTALVPVFHCTCCQSCHALESNPSGAPGDNGSDVMAEQKMSCCELRRRVPTKRTSREQAVARKKCGQRVIPAAVHMLVVEEHHDLAVHSRHISATALVHRTK